MVDRLGRVWAGRGAVAPKTQVPSAAADRSLLLTTRWIDRYRMTFSSNWFASETLLSKNKELGEDSSTADFNRKVPAYDLLQDVTSFDSSVVFLFKALFYPVTAVTLFALCAWLGGRPYSGADFLIAVLTFAGTAELLGDSGVDRNTPTPREFRWLLHIWVRWTLICGCVALIVYLSAIRVLLTDGVLAAWFVSTPFVLWIGAIKMRQLLLYLGIHAKNPQTAIIVGVNEPGLLLSKMLKEQPLGIRLLGFFGDRRAGSTRELPQAFLGRLDDVAAFVNDNGVNV